MRWLVYIVFFSSFQLYAQNVVNPLVCVNSSYMYSIRNSNYYGFDYSIGGGIKINNQWSVKLNFNYLKNKRDNISDDYDALQMLTTSISGSYRFLNQKYRFSPFIELDAGLNVWSNAKGLYVDDNYILHDKPDSYRYLFLSNSILGKTKLLLSIKANSLDFNIGPTFNTYFFHVLDKFGSQYYLEMGIGFEAQVLYTLPMKKRLAKKQAKQVGE